MECVPAGPGRVVVTLKLGQPFELPGPDPAPIAQDTHCKTAVQPLADDDECREKHCRLDEPDQYRPDWSVILGHLPHARQGDGENGQKQHPDPSPVLSGPCRNFAHVADTTEPTDYGSAHAEPDGHAQTLAGVSIWSLKSSMGDHQQRQRNGKSDVHHALLPGTSIITITGRDSSVPCTCMRQEWLDP